ncbi:uncharacterized protein LOC143476481 [Brachyhypopomus gauderio]|uniref:uncharacterized protein LOC143476481 n=1 Tax=Brachyhypopomus gauderio TaxID=698409 RepID=UPI00404185A3
MALPGTSTDTMESQNSMIERAVRSFVSLVSNAHSGVQGPSTTSRPASTSSVQRDMERSFPAMFNGRRNRGKRPVQSVVLPAVKHLEFHFCLLAENSTKTPKNELKLLQAGLGRRTITIPDNADHDEDTCPVCGVQFPLDILFAHASSCGESFDNERPSSSADHDVDEATAVPHQNQETSSNSTVTSIVTDNNAWKNGEDPQGAALLFRRQILQQYERSSPLTAILDLGDSVLDRERSILTFYKAPKVNWASPLHCTLRGDAAIGDGVNRHFISLTMNTLQHGFRLNYGNTDVMLLFEGQPDHLVPCTSQILLDSDLFLIAGRMVGHSFLHGGPALAGISEAVVDVLFGASPDNTTITVEDCPDLERRQTIQLLDGNKDLSEEEKDAVWILADMWDLPGVTSDNRKWLFNRLLHHAVLGRTEKQIKQFRRGLKETCVWQLLTERKDVIPLMFPRERDVEIKPHMVLDQILWPLEKTDEEDEDYPVETRCRIAGYLREFIATASQSSLKGLVQFWTGWEVPSSDMQLEIVQGSLPKASTCFKSLRLPGHYTNFKDFSRDLNSCVATCDTGFGLV